MRDYLLYRKTLRNFEGAELTDSEKVILETFDKDILRKLRDNSNKKLTKQILEEDVPREYALGYKHAIDHFISYFKKYNIK